MAKTKLTGRKRDERITAYAFTAPAVILLIAFLVVPMIYTCLLYTSILARMSRDFGIFMPKHLAGQWHVNSNTKYSLKLS